MKTAEEFLIEKGFNKNSPISGEFTELSELIDQHAEQFRQMTSVTDSLPEDTEMKLVFHQGEFKIAACVTDIRTYWIRMQGNRTIEFVGVTHWMDLPEIPRKKNPEN